MSKKALSERKNEASIWEISWKFFSFLIPAVTVAAIVLIGIYAYIKKSSLEESVVDKLNLIYEVHSPSIAYSLWTLDVAGLERAMKTIAIYPEIFCIEVEDVSEDTQYLWPKNCSGSVDSNKRFVKQLGFNETQIGYLYLHYTDEPAHATLRREIFIGAIFFLFLVLSTCVAVVASLRYIVGKPLSLLLESIRTAEKVDVQQAVNWSSKDELGEVIDAYNGLIAQVNEKSREMVRARVEAEEAAESKGVFLANISHELRTPLHSVITITEMLREEAEDENRDTEAFDRVSGSGRHLLNLIDDILQYTRINVGKVRISNAAFDIGLLIESVANISKPLAVRKNNRLEVVFNCDQSSMVSDELRIKQILLNLIGNACKFTDNGLIVLTVANTNYLDQPSVQFSVKDTGIGISKQNQDRIFDEFAQADLSVTRKYGGTGLGLAISQQLCVLLGGKITLASEVGSGSEFTLTLPSKSSSEKT